MEEDPSICSIDSLAITNQSGRDHLSPKIFSNHYNHSSWSDAPHQAIRHHHCNTKTNVPVALQSRINPKRRKAQNQPFIKRVTRILQPAVLKHKYVDFQLKPPDGDLPVLSYLVHAQTRKEKDKEESHNACYQSAQHSQRSTPPATATSRVFRYIQAGPVS